MVSYAPIEEAWGGSAFKPPPPSSRDYTHPSLQGWAGSARGNGAPGARGESPRAPPKQQQGAASAAGGRAGCRARPPAGVPLPSAQAADISQGGAGGADAFSGYYPPPYGPSDTAVSATRYLNSLSHEEALSVLPPQLLQYLEHKYLSLDDRINTAIQICLVGVVAFVMIDCSLRGG
jgi:hypothetical protein